MASPGDQSSSPSERRREPRDAISATIFIKPSRSMQAAYVPARAMNCSSRGILVETNLPLDRQDAFLARVHDTTSSPICMYEVRHVETAPGGARLVGAAFLVRIGATRDARLSLCEDLKKAGSGT